MNSCRERESLDCKALIIQLQAQTIYKSKRTKRSFENVEVRPRKVNFPILFPATSREQASTQSSEFLSGRESAPGQE